MSTSAGCRPSRSATVIGRMSDGRTSPSSCATGGSTSTRSPASSSGAANTRSRSPVILGIATSTDVAPWRVATSRASAPVPRTRSPLSCMRARRGIVVDEGDRPVRAVGAVQQRARDLGAGVAGSEHDERLGLVVGRAKMTVLDEPGDVAAHRRQHEREERREHRHRARDERAAEQPGEDERGERDDGDAEAEHPHLVEAAVVVAAPVEAERQSDDALQHDRDRDRRGDAGLVHRGELHVVAHERRQRDGDGPRRGVDGVLDHAGRRASTRRSVRPAGPVARGWSTRRCQLPCPPWPPTSPWCKWRHELSAHRGRPPFHGRAGGTVIVVEDGVLVIGGGGHALVSIEVLRAPATKSPGASRATARHRRSSTTSASKCSAPTAMSPHWCATGTRAVFVAVGDNHARQTLVGQRSSRPAGRWCARSAPSPSSRPTPTSTTGYW